MVTLKSCRWKTAIASALLLCGFTLAAAESISAEGTLVYLDTDASSLWRTVRGHTLTLPVVYPEHASTATLTVLGLKYRRTYASVPAGDFELTLPEPTTLEKENVYTLTLTFDDGTVRQAKLGVVQGTSTAGEGATRCIFDATSAAWSKFTSQAVLPIPAGATDLKVNDESIATDLNGAAGWHALAAGRNTNPAKLELTTPEETYLIWLTGLKRGTLLLFR